MINPATTKFVPIANLGAFLEDGGNTPSGPISSFVIATANILNLEKEIESQHNTLRMWTDIAHRLNVPTAVLGIGMQLEFQNIADVSHNNRLELFDFQRVFLEELASHQTSETPAIGTRGYVTSRACSDSGVNQCVSMGCPSLTISRDPNLGATLQAGWDLARQKLMFASNRTSGLGPSKRVKVDGERTAASTCNATLIRRTVEEDGRNKLRVALFAPAITKQSDDVKYRDALYRFLFNIIHEHDAFFVRQSDYDPGQIKEFSQTCGVRGGSATMKEFHNAEDWISSLNGTVDLAVSMRIHGGMSAISAGVPTIVIPTDFRVQEMADAMHIPHVTLEQLESESELHYSHDLAELMNHARNTDFHEFERNRRSKISQWSDILASVGLLMDPALTDILKAPL